MISELHIITSYRHRILIASNLRKAIGGIYHCQHCYAM